ncbi:MAG: transposase [Actinobacteria bacterium]|nr:transposase [Actinomycetota bacterium]
MARRARSLLPDGTFHVTARGVERRRIFLQQRDYLKYARLLAEVAEQHRWTVHAVCLMPNHVHLVVTCTRQDLSDGMRRLNGLYAAWFNYMHGRWGHLFGSRFWCAPIMDESQLETTWTYVLYNPVRAGLCEHPSEWRWSWTPYGMPDELNPTTPAQSRRDDVIRRARARRTTPPRSDRQARAPSAGRVRGAHPRARRCRGTARGRASRSRPPPP